MRSFYTGVGSRETPQEVMFTISELARDLRLFGYVLRSGGAQGADTAFAEGAGSESHIYTPWRGFVSGKAQLAAPTIDAYRLAATVHPAWSRLSGGARALHARNCHQVLGDDLKTPSDFLICWTADGCTSERTRTKNTGGTATAIVLADRNGIPVFNLVDPRAKDRLAQYLGFVGA